MQEKIIYTVIFGDYDVLKEPIIITPGWRYVYYTNSRKHPLNSIWEHNYIPCEPGKEQLLARFIKINFDRFIKNVEQSIWIDASFQINVNLDSWWSEHFKNKMTCIAHPERDCFFKEAQACKLARKGSLPLIITQEKAYEGVVPKNNGLIQSGILMRLLTEEVVAICKDWWEETKKYSVRDQLSFCKVSMDKSFIHYVEGYDYATRQEFIYTGHKQK